MKAPALLREITRGAEVAKSISTGTSDALAQKKAEGVVFSTSVIRSKAANASAKSRSEKSARIAFDVARVLLSDPAYRSLSHKALAELLNRNRTQTGWDRPWTQNSVRSVRQRAEAFISEQAEIDASEDAGLVSANESTSVVLDTTDQPKVEPLPEDHIDEEAEMKKNPLFGMF
jgi:hypothetical protein